MSDIGLALLFWLLFELVSIPLRWALIPFSLSSDLRRMLSRLGGPVLIALATGFAAHGLLPLNPVTCLMVVCLSGGVALLFVFVSMGQQALPSVLSSIFPIERRTWRRDVVLEAFFLMSFLGYVAFRRLAPEMTFEIQNSGAEKFANSMLFWSCWHAVTLPPQDYWFSGLPQTYYYWGHYFWSWLGRLGGFPASAVIALSLARVVTMTAEASYLLLRSFRLSWRAALVGGLLMTWGGNPQSLITLKNQFEAQASFVQQGNEVPNDLSLSHAFDRIKPVLKSWNWESYPFWEPSRVIEGTVNEFPAWSAILGDFHAHHLALPWLIGWFAVLLAGDRWFLRSPSNCRSGYRIFMLSLVFCGLGTAACLANLWSLPVVLIGSGAVVFWRGRRRTPIEVLFPPVLLFVVLGAAFILGGHSPLAPLSGGSAMGEAEQGFLSRLPIKILPGDLRSSTRELLSLWGFQIGILGAAVGIAFLGRLKVPAFQFWFIIGGLLIGARVFLFNGSVIPREEPGLYWAGLACWITALAVGRRRFIPRRAATGGIAACVLLAGLEFFYIQDRMQGELARYNSYFKLSYAAWPLLSAVAFAGAVKLAKLPRPGAWRWVMTFVFLLTLPMFACLWIFGGPARALQAQIGDEIPREPTLNAFAWLEGRPGYQSEAEALLWIREHVPVHEVFAEAPSRGGYSFHGRVASLGGRPIALGWGHHEAQWRGASIYELLAARHESIDAIYRAPDAEALRSHAHALGIEWVILGKSERELYGQEQFDRSLFILAESAEEMISFLDEDQATYVFKIEDVRTQNDAAGR